MLDILQRNSNYFDFDCMSARFSQYKSNIYLFNKCFLKPIGIFLFAILLLVPIGVHAMNAIQVSTSEELMEVLLTATGGETIELAPGTYDPILLHGLKEPHLQGFDAPITITSADADNPATITNLRMHEVGNLHFDSLRFEYTYNDSGDPQRDKPVNLTYVENVSITNSEFVGNDLSGTDFKLDGYGAGIGLWVANSDEIDVSNNSFHNYFRGAVFSSVDSLEVTGNDVSGMSSDGFNFVRVADTLIEDNYFHDFRASPIGDAHMDMIQFWTANTGSPSENVVIRGNLFDSGEGDRTHSIFMRNEEVDRGKAGDEMFYQNILIEDNVIHNSHSHGISVGASNGLIIRNNTLVHNTEVDASEPAAVPRINAFWESYGVEVYGNIVPGEVKVDSSTGKAFDNLVTQATKPGDPNYVQNVFVDALGGRLTSVEDLQVLPGSAGDGVGAELSRFDQSPSDLIAAIRLPSQTMEGTSLELDAGLSRGPAVGQADVPAFKAVAAESGSADGGVTYEWSIYDANGNLVHQDTGVRLNYPADTPGDYVVELVVTGPDGQSATNSAKFSVAATKLLDIDFTDGVAEDSSFYGTGFSINEHGSLVDFGTIKALKMDEQTLVHMGKNSLMYGMESFTIEFGLQRESETSRAGDIFRMHASQEIELTGDGEIRFWMFNDDGEKFTITTSGADITDTEWHHVAVTFDGASNKVGIYVNGDLLGSGEVTGTTESSQQWWGPTLGNPWHPNFDGYISHLSVDVNPIDAGDAENLSGQLHAVVQGSEWVPPQDDQQGSVDPTDPVADTAFAFNGILDIDGDDKNDVHLRGSAQLVDGGDGQDYVDLDGGYVSFGRDADFFEASELSLFMNFRTDAPNEGTARLLWNHMQYGVELVGDDKLVFKFMNGDRTRVEVDDLDINAGEWHSVGFAFDESNGAFKAYLDGEMIASSTLDGISIGKSAYWDVWAGGTPWGRNLEGDIGNVAVYHEFIDEDDVPSYLQNEQDTLLV